jgi:flagellar motor switch protein FliN/FliY
MNAKSEAALPQEEIGGQDVNLDVILDVPVTLSMEVGRTRIPIRNLLQLNQGSVVELDRAAGEPLDVFVNGTLVACPNRPCSRHPTPRRTPAVAPSK